MCNPIRCEMRYSCMMGSIPLQEKKFSKKDICSKAYRKTRDLRHCRDRIGQDYRRSISETWTSRSSKSLQTTARVARSRRSTVLVQCATCTSLSPLPFAPQVHTFDPFDPAYREASGFFSSLTSPSWPRPDVSLLFPAPTSPQDVSILDSPMSC